MRKVRLSRLMSTAHGTRGRGMAVAAAVLTVLCTGILAPAQPAVAASFTEDRGEQAGW